MSEGIQFDEDKNAYGPRPGYGGGQGPGKGQPAMVRWLMDKGIAKSPAMAQGILIGVIIVCFLVVIMLLA